MQALRSVGNFFARGAAAALLFGAGLFVWAFAVEPASLRVEEQRIEISPWPEACRDLRVAVLADLHVGSPFNGIDKLREILAVTRAERPELVLLAGDYVIQGVIGGRFVSPEAAAQEIAKLRDGEASPQIHAVLGNHDWWLDGERVARALEGAGVGMLEDAARPIEVARGEGPSCRFWLAGISDFMEGAHDVDKALAELPSRAPAIAFTHNPDIFPVIRRAWH